MTRLLSRSGRSAALIEIVSAWPKEARILEVGCNAGRNLAALFDAGWMNVAGVEINEHAVRTMRETFPQLADVEVGIGPAEELLPAFDDGAFDLVFTMAVLQHIHPESIDVFDNIARIAKSLVAIEMTDTRTERTFPHDVVKLFESRGMALEWQRPMSSFPQVVDDRSMRSYTVFAFGRSDRSDATSG